MTKVLILGQEGYIGTALTLHLEGDDNYIVAGVDNYSREKNVRSIGSESLTVKKMINAPRVDVSQPDGGLWSTLDEFQPDVIVHLAEQPSAPFSMRSADDAMKTQQNNIIGTLNLLWAVKELCPNAHIIKLGTEGEYPDWLWNGKHIPEGGRMEVQFNGLNNIPEPWTIPTPRYAGSWYHFSKLHDSMNIDYACRIWGLRATDVNQGVLYGHVPGTRFDYDEHFGTVVNRFVTQAVAGMPLTIYGEGGQTRGFIALQNSIEAIKLLIDNPPEKGEFRVIHQTTQEYSVNDIAKMVQDETKCELQYLDNPRVEMNANKFTFDTSTLTDLGLNPVKMEDVLPGLIATVRERKDKIIKDVIMPKTTWK
jgi:UDP-sulfoquinovose synthase